jgi:hypothetical protein
MRLLARIERLELINVFRKA